MQCAIKTTAELVVRNDPVASRVERMTESPEVQPLVCGWLVSPVMVTSIDPVPPPVIEMPHRAPWPGLSICPLITALEALLSLITWPRPRPTVLDVAAPVFGLVNEYAPVAELIIWKEPPSSRHTIGDAGGGEGGGGDGGTGGGDTGHTRRPTSTSHGGPDPLLVQQYSVPPPQPASAVSEHMIGRLSGHIRRLPRSLQQSPMLPWQF